MVYNCDSSMPDLRLIPDPAGKGAGRPKGGVVIDATEIINLSVSEDA